jgi:hypothetical protein
VLVYKYYCICSSLPTDFSEEPDLLMKIFAKFPVTLLQITSQGCYFGSSGAPMYISKNGKVPYTTIFSGGFIDEEGKFKDPNNDEIKHNNCLYNEILRYPYTSPFYGDHKEGSYNNFSKGCFVSQKTVRRYVRKEIKGCICSYISLDVNMPLNHSKMKHYEYFYSLLTGNCSSVDGQGIQMIGVVNGKGFQYSEV